MQTYSRQKRGADWASQSRVVKSGQRLSDRSGLDRWSVHLMRSRSRHGGTERRSLTLFVSVGRVRFEVGTR